MSLIDDDSNELNVGIAKSLLRRLILKFIVLCHIGKDTRVRVEKLQIAEKEKSK